MKAGVRVIITLIGAWFTSSSVLANSDFVLIQFVRHFGAESRHHVELGLSSTELIREYQYLGSKLATPITVPLYTSTSNNNAGKLNVSNGSQSLCRRKPVACIAIGAIVGAGAIYVISEASKDIESGNAEITIKTKSD